MNPGLKNLRVMVVDDTALMRDLIRGILTAAGVGEADSAASCQDALALMAQRPYDLLFVDWEMQPTSGVEFVRYLRNDADSPNPYIPVIMVTSHAEKARVIEARDAGVHEYIVKPVTGRSVLSRLATIVNQPRPFVRTDSYFGPAPRHAPGGLLPETRAAVSTPAHATPAL